MGCCNSKPKTKEAPKAPAPVVKPRAAEPVVEKVEEKPKEIKQEDPRLVRIRAIQEARQQPFRYNKCTISDGAVSALLEEGLIYRIVKDDVWFIYNDSLQYEAHLEHCFPAGTAIQVGERTVLEETDDGELRTRLVVYPLETIRYVATPPPGHRGSVTAKPLSEAFLEEHRARLNEAAARALEAAKATAEPGADAAAVLARCVETQTPFVDPDFPPTPRMLYREGIDGHALREVAMRRPGEFLPAGEAPVVFRGAVVPHAVEAGLLGDCWWTTAAAVLAEREAAIRAIFATTRASESALGGYRIGLNKHGWWRSVLVDDYLPTIAGVPVFARSEDPREGWVALLQKAYAKLHGSYAAITGGDALQALQDLTGAPAQRFDEAWAAAAGRGGREKEEGLRDHLTRALAAGALVVLSTPSPKQLPDAAAARERFAAVGLELSYTYSLDRVVAVAAADGRGLTLLKVRNPWRATGRWTGPWGAASDEWAANPAAAAACGPCEPDGSFWIAFDDAVEYFNGGGVVWTPADAVDHRVKGAFHGVEPSVVLKVTASKRVELLLVLSQQDKRGLPEDDPSARFAPLMLSVAKHAGGKFRVEQNSSGDPVCPSPDYHFAVARDVALRYTFEPSEAPYLVIPRLHGKGVVDGFDRPFVLGVLSSGSVDDAVSIEFTHLPADNRVFQNLRTFSVERLPFVEAEHQRYLAGELPVSKRSNRACGVATEELLPVVTLTSSSSKSSNGKEEEEAEEEEEASAALNEAVDGDIDFKVREDSATPGRDTEVHRMG